MTVTNRERVHTYLLVKSGGAERIIVWDTQDVSVGRAPENDLSIDDAVLSRKHAEFYRSEGAYAVKDLNTSNGTTVNGESIRQRVLASKDVVKFGDVEIQFVQVAKNPAQIGKKVEFASQLKNFGGAAGQAKDGEATMLGLMQTVDSDEEFVVGKVNDFGSDLEGMKEPAKRDTPRNLDLELSGLDDEPPPPKPPQRQGATPVPAKPGPKPAPRLAPVQPDWALDDADPRPAAPQARSAPRAAAPAPAAAAAGGSVSLHLEIAGLSGELRRALESLLGKGLELPPLKIRVKSDDLG
jgi:predicted component of type VI protein secretion system